MIDVKTEYLPMEDGQQKDSQSNVEVKEKEQKDAELDKKINALKKKNEALMQRHREIEEDRLRAEKGGRAVTSRRPKQDGLTITITNTPHEKRIVRKARRSSDSSERRVTLCMGNDMQLCVSMESKEEDTRTVSKKIDQDVLFLTTKLSMEDVNNVVSSVRGPRMQIGISRQKESDVPKVQRKREKSKNECKIEYNKEPGDTCEMGCSDLSAAEHSDYMQWKKEREQVDTERLARQKNHKGEWRRTWDKGKSEDMFGGEVCNVDAVPIALSGRRERLETDWGRKMHSRDTGIENKGAGKQICNEKTLRTMNTMSSNAKGRDRLTGRAQRWQILEHEDLSYLSGNPPVQNSLDDKVTIKHSEGNFKEDEFNNQEKLKVPVQSNSLGYEEKIVFANEKILPERKQDVPIHGKKMDVRSDNVVSEGRETMEYLSVLGCDGEVANSQQEQRSS
ncbi:hypothetical protein GDO81_015000 [Engystomops pustulosus]|uniref:Coiled-coil domain-containing protein 9B n=2 Tax=Engystomops pustulosus TaxID=76066 RepID=A0AAV7AKB7_ENGPU|nr:hypothetical protein GDO81_015000 [Engystomops pustulosus]KAG8560475.1 hypothetical protein GDO81_015000 [Engystomops pustulosus]